MHISGLKYFLSNALGYKRKRVFIGEMSVLIKISFSEHMEN